MILSMVYNLQTANCHTGCVPLDHRHREICRETPKPFCFRSRVDRHQQSTTYLTIKCDNPEANCHQMITGTGLTLSTNIFSKRYCSCWQRQKDVTSRCDAGHRTTHTVSQAITNTQNTSFPKNRTTEIKIKTWRPPSAVMSRGNLVYF